jgi:hypothetical protein
MFSRRVFPILTRSSKLGARSSIKLPSLPVRPVFRFEILLARWFLLLLACFEYALFATADALVRVQSF